MSYVNNWVHASQKAAEQKAAEQKIAEQKAAEQKVAEQKIAEQKAAEEVEETETESSANEHVDNLAQNSCASESLSPIAAGEQEDIDKELRKECASTPPDLSENKLLTPKPQKRIKLSRERNYVAVKKVPVELIEMAKQTYAGRTRLSNGDVITLAFLEWFRIDEKDAKKLLKDRPQAVWEEFKQERKDLNNVVAREQYHKRVLDKQNELSFDVQELKVLLTYLLLKYDAALDQTDVGQRLSFDVEGVRSVLLNGKLTSDTHNLVNMKRQQDGRPIH